jgi:hypothetical protein
VSSFFSSKHARCIHFAELTGIVTYCFELKEPQHVLFQIANGFFLVACFTSDTPPGVLAMHALLMIGTPKSIQFLLIRTT